MYNLSIIIPLYNEEKRVAYCLQILSKFLENKQKFDVEIIFVDDGSYDNTAKIIKKFIKKNNKYSLNIISYKRNVGKGFAIKKGILKSSKKWKLICDADMSVKLIQFDEWFKKKLIQNENCAYFGSRNHKNSKIKTSIIREGLGLIFKFILRILFKIKISDTQCGFKVFHKKYAKKIFAQLTSYRFAFDVELTLILKKKNILIKELPLRWEHKNNSKLSLIRDMPLMFLDILKIKIKQEFFKI